MKSMAGRRLTISKYVVAGDGRATRRLVVCAKQKLEPRTPLEWLQDCGDLAADWCRSLRCSVRDTEAGAEDGIEGSWSFIGRLD